MNEMFNFYKGKRVLVTGHTGFKGSWLTLILTEMGALGFASIFTFVIFPIFQSFYYYLKTKDLNFILMISSIMCWLIGFYSTYSLGDVRIKILVGSIIALMIVYRTLKKSTEETEIEEDIDSETITEN
jgi:predicted membrane protein